MLRWPARQPSRGLADGEYESAELARGRAGPGKQASLSWAEGCHSKWKDVILIFFYVYPIRTQQQPSGQLALPKIGQLVYGPTCGASGWGRLNRALNTTTGQDLNSHTRASSNSIQGAAKCMDQSERHAQDSDAFLKAEEDGLGALSRAGNEATRVGRLACTAASQVGDTRHVGREQPTVRGETWTTGPIQEAYNRRRHHRQRIPRR